MYFNFLSSMCDQIITKLVRHLPNQLPYNFFNHQKYIEAKNDQGSILILIHIVISLAIKIRFTISFHCVYICYWRSCIYVSVLGLSWYLVVSTISLLLFDVVSKLIFRYFKLTCIRDSCTLVQC